MKIRKSKIYVNMFVGSSAHTCEQTVNGRKDYQSDTNSVQESLKTT